MLASVYTYPPFISPVHIGFWFSLAHCATPRILRVRSLPYSPRYLFAFLLPYLVRLSVLAFRVSVLSLSRFSALTLRLAISFRGAHS